MNSPIGVFDSGLGGLSVLRCIRDLLPNESTLYVADTAYIPYGDKSADEILSRARAITQFFISRDVKAIVVACNTATAAAIHELRAEFKLPIIGMEPGIKPALANTRSGVVGVLATQSTLTSDKFRVLLSRFHTEAKFLIQPCPGLVELIEEGKLDHEQTRSVVSRYLQPLLDADADTIVLGCTHYPFIAPLLTDLGQGKIQLIDTGPAVARQLKRQLESHNLLAGTNHVPTYKFYSSGLTHEVEAVMTKLWGEQLKVESFEDH